MRRIIFFSCCTFYFVMIFAGQLVSAQQQMPDYVLHAAQTLNSQYGANIDLNNVIWDYVDYALNVENATSNCPRLSQDPPALNNSRVYRVEFQPVRDGTWGDEIWEAIVFGDLSYVGLCSAPIVLTPVPAGTPFPTFTPTNCGMLPSRLVIGQEGRVAGETPNNLRADFGTSGQYVGEIPAQAVFLVLDGPRCTADGAWWSVNHNGIVGWTLEGQDGTYYLEPASLAPVATSAFSPTATPVPTTAPIVCNPSMPSRMIIGEIGRVTPGIPNNVRAQAGSSSQYVGEIPAEAVFRVLDGPACASGLAWWQVDYNGMVGYTAEGADGDYWIEPTFATIPVFSMSENRALYQYASFEVSNIRDETFDTYNIFYVLDDDSVQHYVVNNGFADSSSLTWSMQFDVGVIAEPLAIHTEDENVGWIVGKEGNGVKIGFYGETYQDRYVLDINANQATFSPDGRYLMLVDESQSIHVIDTTVGQAITVLPSQNGGLIKQMVFSPDGQVFAAGYNTGFIVWQVNNWSTLYSTFFESPQNFQAVTLTNSHIAFAVASSQDAIAFVVPLNDIPSWTTSGGIRHSVSANALTLTPDNSFLLLSTSQGLEISPVVADEFLIAESLNITTAGAIQQLQLSDDGRFLALVTENGVEIWGLSSS